MERFINRIDNIPRSMRKIITAVATLAMIVVFGYFVDQLFTAPVTEGDLSPWVPTLLYSVVGVILYAVGWGVLVGFADETPEQHDHWHATRNTAYYLIVAAIAVGLIILGVAYGLLWGVVGI